MKTASATTNARSSDTKAPKEPAVNTSRDMFTDKSISEDTKRIRLSVEKGGKVEVIGCATFESFMQVCQEANYKPQPLHGYMVKKGGGIFIAELNVTMFAKQAPLGTVRLVRASASSKKLSDAMLVNRSTSAGHA